MFTGTTKQDKTKIIMLLEERQKDNNQQIEEEEKLKCAADETGAQSLTEEGN